MLHISSPNYGIFRLFHVLQAPLSNSYDRLESMMNKRRGLGSGLDALLAGTAQPGGVREVAIGTILPNPRQPRTQFDDIALDELASSIREHGIIQPLIVSERAVDRYELIAGERRWRAAQRAGLARVPVLIRETTPQELLELALIENVQRADLNALEEAQAYQSLKDEFGLSDEQIARRVGKKSREVITNTRRLLRLAPEVQEAILKATISAGHGRALLKIESHEQQQAALAAIHRDELNVREVERLGTLLDENGGDISHALAAIHQQRADLPASRSTKSRSSGAPPRPTTLSAEDEDLKRQIEQLLQTPVSIARTDKELRVTIVFHTDEKLQEFFDGLNGAYSH
jgi:ParB family chromosome partitioning protein